VDKQLDTYRPGPPCEPVLRWSVCPSRSCTERIKNLVHGEAHTTDTNRRRRKAPRLVPALTCRTARLSPRQDACCAPIRAGHERRFRRRPPGNHPRKGCGWVVHNGASARLRANWNGPVHGRAESGTPRCGQPVRDSAMRTRRNYPTCSSPLDSSAHRRASGRFFFGFLTRPLGLRRPRLSRGRLEARPLSLSTPLEGEGICKQPSRNHPSPQHFRIELNA
jgi:hypothetical protein